MHFNINWGSRIRENHTQGKEGNLRMRFFYFPFRVSRVDDVVLIVSGKQKRAEGCRAPFVGLGMERVCVARKPLLGLIPK